MKKSLYFYLLICCLCRISFSPVDVQATFVEQILVHTRAMSLANSVTADPPGHMSIHYNPAGLSHLRDGIVLSQGFALAKLERTYHFEPDPTFQLSGVFKATDDPLANSDGKIKNGRIYIPFYGPLNMPVLAAPVPVGMSYRAKNSRFTFANGIYAPYAGGMEHDDDDPSRYQGKSVYLQHIILFSPSASCEIVDGLSLGISMGFGQTAIGGETDARAPNELISATKIMADASNLPVIPAPLKNVLPLFGGGFGPFEKVADMEFNFRDDVTPSYNVGILWEPMSWLSLGAVYQSSVKATLRGRYTFRYTDSFLRMTNWMKKNPASLEMVNLPKLSELTDANESGDAKMEDFELPQRVQIGLMVKPIPKLKLLMDAHWANWSSTESYVIVFDKPIQAMELVKLLGYEGGDSVMEYRKDFKDTWHWSAGVEYQLYEFMSLRFGYENRKTCAQDYLFDLFSLPDVHFLGTGMGLKFRKGIDVDLGLAYLFNNNYKVPNNKSFNLNSNDLTKPVYNPYAGQNYETSFRTYIASVNVTLPLDTLSEMVESVTGKRFF